MSVFPRVRKCGVAAWYFLDGELQSCAFASLPLRGVTEAIRRLEPTALIIESYRENGWEPGLLAVTGVSRLLHVRPSWSKDAISIPRGAYVGRVSPLAHRAFSLGFFALFQRRKLPWPPRVKLAELNEEWLRKYGKY